ncbi:PsbB mRNA maturation factor Mbb1 [Chloropicon primus]|uniref:PsbB mRNA maturation factor Mbb1 n=1 Tax=Chloropicon primus TaxID=1764295 RepID=A0A5B8MXA6_9CHLO|nr:PsbB mRNA maturation factor Mbb1 [Chloropicon primus]UPR03972.1 PsbB mRNA maturation factor Mbb1 [Chloropicon primus]|eukprot:QDZ24766.1 PsbB mRNA maturation factor Mbb1 [Chloropicon primus]
MAKKVCEDGCAATKGENAHVWQVWGSLEWKHGGSGGGKGVQRARQLFDAAIAADKTLISAYHSWAMLEKREGNKAKARQLLVKGLAAADHGKRPASHVYVALARLAESESDVEAARQWYKLGVASGNFRDCGPALTAWAIMEAKQGNEKVSRELFQKSLKGAKSRFAWLSLGTWELRWGNIEEAREVLREACDLFPSDAAIAQGYANSFTKSSEKCEADMEMARDLFEKAVDIDDKNQYAYYGWAMGEWLLDKDVDRARELFQEGIWSGPTTSQAAKLFSSWAHMEAVEDQNIELSRSLYSCANKIKPKSTKILLNWAKDERSVGEEVRGEELEGLARSISAGHSVQSQRQQTAKLHPGQVVNEISETKSLTALSIETNSEIVRTLAESLESISYSSEASEAVKVLPEIVDEFITKWNMYFENQKRFKRSQSRSVDGGSSPLPSPIFEQ